MKVIGLLTSEEEVEEIQFIAKICTLQNRIRYINYLEKTKQVTKKKNQ